MRYGPTLKNEKNLTDSDPVDYGDAYSLTAMTPDTRLFLSVELKWVVNVRA
jgi:hypothetical protein